MPLHPELTKKLSVIFAPQTSIGEVSKGYDSTFVTNEHGELVLLFFGKRQPDGLIKGQRYTRAIKCWPSSLEIKSSHWDNQGKTGR